ncbi:MAG: YitT family protein [Lachnospiraceae bacterium]|nr:YitT family protein [Lachnospiraceae bacterium]
MKLLFKHKKLKTVLFIIVGDFLMAAMTNMVFDPSGIVLGGFSGIAIIVKHLTGGRIPLWLTTLVLNVPLFLAAWRIKGWPFIRRTVFSTAVFTAFLAIIPARPIVEDPDMLLQVVFGGIIYGIGLGLIFYVDTTTGGTDTSAALIHEKIFKYYSIPQIMQVLDGIIILAGLITFSLRIGLYSIIAVAISAKISDMVLEGSKFAKGVYIVSNSYRDIAEAIMKEIDRGATALHAEGMYSREEKNMLFVALNKKEIVRLKEIVYGMDPKAFMIVMDAREVLGEGFVKYE